MTLEFQRQGHILTFNSPFNIDSAAVVIPIALLNPDPSPSIHKRWFNILWHVHIVTGSFLLSIEPMPFPLGILSPLIGFITLVLVAAFTQGRLSQHHQLSWPRHPRCTPGSTVLCELTGDFCPVLSPSCVAEDSRPGEGLQVCLGRGYPRLHHTTTKINCATKFKIMTLKIRICQLFIGDGVFLYTDLPLDPKGRVWAWNDHPLCDFLLFICLVEFTFKPFPLCVLEHVLPTLL